jgi:hypothetical protein
MIANDRKEVTMKEHQSFDRVMISFSLPPTRVTPLAAARGPDESGGLSKSLDAPALAGLKMGPRHWFANWKAWLGPTTGISAMETGNTSTYQQRPHGNSRSAVLALSWILAGVTPLAAQSPFDNFGNQGIAPPGLPFEGKTYGGWSAAWFQYVFSRANSANPLMDAHEVDCSAGQTGNVWFIGGKLGGSAPFPPEGRSCTIPQGTALFVNLASNWVDNTGCSATNPPQIQPTHIPVGSIGVLQTLRNFAYTAENDFLSHTLSTQIDGVDVRGFPQACDPSNPSTCQSPYRVQSPVFRYTVPATDNILASIGETCYDNLSAPFTVEGAVADGVYVMIDPLPVGRHTIQWQRLGGPLRLYTITVTP